MTKPLPFHLEELLEDFPTVDLLAHPSSVSGRWEAVLVLSEGGESLFLRKGKPLTGFLNDVQNTSLIVSGLQTHSWLTEAEKEQDLIAILGTN